jgi:hypothetical protein
LSIIFGLGNDRHIRQIDINWPSGLVTSLTEVTLNQSIIIEEN